MPSTTPSPTPTTIVTCDGVGEQWLINPSDPDNPDSPMAPFCPTCENMAKDLDLKVRIVRDKKNDTYKAQPATVGAHEVEVEGYALEYVLVSGDFIVHDLGCKGLERDVKRSDYEAPARLFATDKTDAMRILWDDQLAEAWSQDDDPEATGSDPLVDVSAAYLSKHRYTNATHFHTCVDKLMRPAKGAGRGGKGKTTESGYTPRQAKRDLATLLVQAIGAAIDGLPDDSDILSSLDRATAKQVTAQWIHHLPADRTEWLKSLPAPDRSDWKVEATASPSETDNADSDTDTDDNDDTAE